MTKKYKVAYLSYFEIEAEDEREAQRKLIRHLEQFPDAATRLYGNFVPLQEAWVLLCKLQGLSDEAIQELMERIGPTLVNPE